MCVSTKIYMKAFKYYDPIEIGLKKWFGKYILKYRFLPKKIKIPVLWFHIMLTVRDAWHVICVRHNQTTDTNQEINKPWTYVVIDMHSETGQKTYENFKKSIHTYQDLGKTFNKNDYRSFDLDVSKKYMNNANIMISIKKTKNEKQRKLHIVNILKNKHHT